ncbi:2-phospho-L-lactate guanylyltransferase [Actinoalloteichus hymeniacidonis]|uniref:Phosphoenolpyruvate guanylyltransferase n=1 Tax=Actinoalloteichus hymeniacidonis TaxID=340345 RepID=A0AAC9HTB9_9PSEU|nr:2-phospho-L-lactate guanylyltransferase [Actinoalloteichus hymeniacidonis]AOS65307.1 2-phospho-L-lactate guanylyltransferase [Actinoalloteichus hymeniacidonis]MBB5906608.1 2-phospho-L-lactate guanylyltransferase [Actinoalloteichus hymeniacidonis]
MCTGVDLLVPVKMLHAAKSRLLGAADDGVGNPERHAQLVVALLLDTLTAARAAEGVRRVIAVTSDLTVSAAVRAEGLTVLAEPPSGGLNAALQHGSTQLLSGDPTVRVGALQADLPALRSEDLAEALAQAGDRRAFCADRQGTGTTMLIAAPGSPLLPGFGVGSAERHAASGAVQVGTDRPTLRCDVDTEDDLRAAAGLGLGENTRAVLAQYRRCDRHAC